MAEANNERKLQALVMQAQSYQAALQDVARQTALIERAAAEITATIEAITELPKSKQDEAMVPIGGGVFAKAKILDKKAVLVAVGSGIYAEKPVAQAKTFLTERKAKLEANLKILSEQSKKISVELEKASGAAEELYAKLQQGP